jgi:hypothetical protein
VPGFDERAANVSLAGWCGARDRLAADRSEGQVNERSVRVNVIRSVCALAVMAAVVAVAAVLSKATEHTGASALGGVSTAVVFPSYFADSPLLQSILSPEPAPGVVKPARASSARVPYVLDPVIGRKTAPTATPAGKRALPTAPAVGGVGIPAQVLPFTPEKTFLASYATTDYGSSPSAADDLQGTTQWRIVVGSGNCCETHVTTSKEGRIYDIGGSYIRYSDDRGVSWSSVQPVNPLVNGEGSIAMAPNGDVLGMTWDAYSGDHFVAYKYDAVANQWLTWENPIHQAVYDRPWLTVVPGPFVLVPGALSAPYISFVQGGTGVKDPLWVSNDGLSYLDSSSFIVDGQIDTPVVQSFPIQADASFDWIQPIRAAPVTGLGAGRALAAGNWLLNPEDRRWDQWHLPDPPNATPPTYIQIDSAGRINHVRSITGGFEYRISKNGGQSWTTSGLIPFSLGGLNDFRANYVAGVAAIALRIGDQDWVYKLDISSDTARLTRRYKVGLGDTVAVSGVQVPPRPRFDFKSIAILPDGRVVHSFLDSTTFWHPPGVSGVMGIVGPANAIEGDTTLGPTAVAIRSFRAHRSGTTVVLRWRTASEVDVAGFDLYRGRVRLNRALIAAKQGGHARGATYSFRARVGRGAYRLRVMKFDGSSSWLAPVRLQP